MNVIFKVVFSFYALTDQQIKSIIEIVDMCPALIKQCELSEVSKPLSLFAFTIREIYEVITGKDEFSGESMFMLRKAYRNFKLLKVEEERLKTFLK